MSDRVAELPHLIARIAQGDEQAMERLHRSICKALRVYVWKIVGDHWTAEEVVQDVFRFVWLNASTYSADRGSPNAWLYTIARSRALDALRKSNRHPSHLVVGDEGIEPATIEVQELWVGVQLNRSIGKLTSAQQYMIHLSYFEGYSHDEISQRTGIPLGTVKTRVRIAIEKLRADLMGEKRLCRTVPIAPPVGPKAIPNVPRAA
jgi:RNA polymerase sigma-70 factor, ECF subfamily